MGRTHRFLFLLLALALGLTAWLALEGNDDEGPVKERGTSPAREGVADRTSSEPAPERLPHDDLVPSGLSGASRREARPGRALTDAQPEATSTVTGRVVIGGPIPPDLDARVVAVAYAGAPRRAIATSEGPVATDGSFSVGVPSRSDAVLLRTSSPVLRQSEDVEVPPDTHGVVLRADALASVRVFVTGRPEQPEEEHLLLDHRVLAQCFTQNGENAIFSGYFAAKANLEIPELPAGVPLSIAVSREIHDPRTAHRQSGMSGWFEVTLEPLERRDVVVNLQPHRNVRGVVVDAGGLPVPGARIRALRPIGSSDSRGPSPRFADEHGRFRIGPLGSGGWLLVASAEGHENGETRVTVREDEESEVRIALGTAPVVSGRVVNSEGHPVIGAAVRNPQSAGPGVLTDEHGAFRITLHSGEVGLVAHQNGASSSVTRLLLQPGEQLEDVLLVVAQQGWAVGR